MIAPFRPLLLALYAASASLAWVPSSFSIRNRSPSVIFGYLDDLSRANTEKSDDDGSLLQQPGEDANLNKDEVDRFGVGDWSNFVDFDEFDGGDGQMGVAGDGKKGLDKEWEGESHFAKSRARSAKNAWGSSTGYADELIKQGVEATRAQQMENWQNQQELTRARNQHKFSTDQFDQVGGDEDWRNLSKFGVERNEDFNLDESFGDVVVGNTVYHHIELSTRVNRAEVFEFNLLNSFMGYSDFRARFTPETPGDWTVEPTEGSLNGKKGTDFVVKFRPSNPGVSMGYLVIQTEDDKWTFQVTGTASM